MSENDDYRARYSAGFWRLAIRLRAMAMLARAAAGPARFPAIPQKRRITTAGRARIQAVLARVISKPMQRV